MVILAKQWITSEYWRQRDCIYPSDYLAFSKFSKESARIMKFIGIVFGIALVLGLVGIIAIAMMDVPVQQSQITKTVSNERFYTGAAPQ